MKSTSGNRPHQKSQGQLTAEIGKRLIFEDHDVLYDHDASGGRIVSFFGDKNERGGQLSYLDIAVVKKNSNKVIALIEIEETANRPKTIIADIFGFLMGEKVVFQGRELEVGNETSLIVLGFSKVPQLKHNQYILEKVEKAKSALGTKNSEIGRVILKTCSDKDRLFARLKSLIDDAIRGQL